MRRWTEHVLAENRRDLERLIETLAEDAVYEIVPLKKEMEFKRHKEGVVGRGMISLA